MNALQHTTLLAAAWVRDVAQARCTLHAALITIVANYFGLPTGFHSVSVPCKHNKAQPGPDCSLSLNYPRLLFSDSSGLSSLRKKLDDNKWRQQQQGEEQ